jgi:hypothetical protein
LATLIVSTLEGSLMVSRLQRKEEALDSACHHLEEYLESRVRAQNRQVIESKNVLDEGQIWSS